MDFWTLAKLVIQNLFKGPSGICIFKKQPSDPDGIAIILGENNAKIPFPLFIGNIPRE